MRRTVLMSMIFAAVLTTVTACQRKDQAPKPTVSMLSSVVMTV